MTKKAVILHVLLFIALIAGVLSCDDAGVMVNSKNAWIRLDTSTGQDAYITDFYSTTNFKDDPDFAGIAWCVDTLCTLPYKGRTLFKFNLNNIPPSSTVTDAKLLLSFNPACFHSPSPGHRNNGGSNACLLQKIMTSWIDSSVTWSNQPTTVTLNQVTVPASTTEIENYSIDITGLVNDMVKNPASNFGLMLSLETETPLRSLNFASSNNADTVIRPLLLITYTE